MNLILEIKKKREFSGLSNSIVERVLNDVDSVLDDKSRIKETRSMLRKYFGVFLTNKVIKPRDILDYDSVLKSHKSSAKRDYDVLYEKLRGVTGSVKSIVDFGCGMNGFSYEFLKRYLGEVKYFGIEASSQVVDNMNIYFRKMKFNAEAYCLDLFDLKSVKSIIKKTDGNKLFFCFQVVDALEKMERDFSRKFLLELKKQMNKGDWLVVSLPMVSLSSKSEFRVKRNWLFDFLGEEFNVVDDFQLFEERFFVMRVA